MRGDNCVRVGEAKLGETIVFTVSQGYHSHTVWAKITKITPKNTVTVAWGKERSQTFRPGFRDCYSFRRPSPEEIRLKKWLRSRPRPKHVELRFSFQNENQPCNVSLSIADLDSYEESTVTERRAAIRTAAEELLAIDKWLSERPT